MKLKILGVFTLIFAVLLPSSVFANTFDYNNGLLDDENIIKSNSLPIESYDNDLATRGIIDLNEKYFIEFNYLVNLEQIFYKTNSTETRRVKIHFINDTDNTLSVIEVLGEEYLDLNISNVYKIEISNGNANYHGHLDEIEFFGTYGNQIPDEEIENPEPIEPIDDIPPANISNLNVTLTDTSANFTYDLPNDEDFSHLIITRDGQTIADNHVLNSFNDTGLATDTLYTYVFKSVDTSGNVSSGNVKVITTMPLDDTIPPTTPTGLTVSEMNGSLVISWNPNEEPDLAGYNLYLNGNKYNTSLIMNNSFNIYNLNNGTSYEIAVSAVDTFGNESLLTTVKTAIPSEDALPLFELNHDLKDVAKSTENWFSEMWLILAFAVAIPLSFYIAQRVKSLFLA